MEKARPISSLIDEFDRTGTEQLHPQQQPSLFTAEAWRAMNAKERHDVLAGFRLAYMAEIPVNWCAGLGTVLANEEVEEWTAKGYTVERIPMNQWMMRITAFAERLRADLDQLDWPASTKEMLQHNKCAG